MPNCLLMRKIMDNIFQQCTKDTRQDNCLSLQNCFKKFHCCIYPQQCVVLTFARSRITRNNKNNNLEVEHPTTQMTSRNRDTKVQLSAVYMYLETACHSKDVTPTPNSLHIQIKEPTGSNRQGLQKQQVRWFEVKVLNETANFGDEGLFEWCAIIPSLYWVEEGSRDV